MSQVTLKGTPLTLAGKFPQVGETVTNFVLTTNDLKDAALDDFKDQQIILNIFPSVDTSTCANSVIKFNTEAAKLKNTTVLCISKDLPFAQARFCGAQDLTNVKTLSAFRASDFARQFGVDITSGALQGLLARAVIVLNPKHQVTYTELVSEITQEPDYAKCLAALQGQ